MDVTTDTTGLDGLIKRLSGADKVVRTAAFQVEANAKTAIQTGAKSGRIYKRGKGKTHQSSAPGEAPATDTGNLVNGISTQKVSDANWEVPVAADYAAKLEEDRPFLEPSVKKVEAAFNAAALKLLEG